MKIFVCEGYIMRRKKPEGRTSGGITRLRLEEGWNYDKRKKTLTKNKQMEGQSDGRRRN